MTDLAPFDPNDYRKRVLAAVEKRGGAETSDPFELYDLPPVDDLDDAAVAARVAEVWGFWQRQRDHPKYRVLVGLLVAAHDGRSAELLDGGRRRTAAARVRAQREQRDSARFELLDAAISRLVARHRGVPRDKVEGLYDVGALGGLTRDEVDARLRRHRRVDVAAAAPPAPAGPAIGAERRRQVQALLVEFGRLTDVPAPPTLLALLGLEPDAAGQEVRARAGAWRSRARELPPERLRSVVDELLVHVTELLEPGRAAVETYLDAVAADVTDLLRPRVRAAVLVEDRLVADDHAHLLDEATAAGLDPVRARAVLAALAAELGAPIGDDPAAAPAPGRPVAGRPAQDRARRWEEPLRAARAALRAGRPTEAQRLVADARRLAGADGATPVRAVADEVEAVLAEAALRWRAAAGACAARRWVEAAEHLEHLTRTAADVPDSAGEPGALLARAREEVARADAAVAAALDCPAAERPAALLAVLDACPEHPGAAAALAALPLDPPPWVRAAHDGTGSVLVVWAASPSEGATYKVSRLRPDGGWQVVGRVTGTSVVDGGAPPAVEVPVYAVVALQAGRTSAPTRSDTQTPATQTPATQTPATQTPATQTPATQTPATQTPATQTPATQTPAVQPPAAQPGPATPAPTARISYRRPERTRTAPAAPPPTPETSVPPTGAAPDPATPRPTDPSGGPAPAPGVPATPAPGGAEPAPPAAAPAPAASADPTPTDGPPAPTEVRAVRGTDGTVTVRWDGPVGAEFRVRCAAPDGRWRVVGRTRAHEIEDGGAPEGPVPTYTVSAAVDGARSTETASAQPRS